MPSLSSLLPDKKVFGLKNSYLSPSDYDGYKVLPTDNSLNKSSNSKMFRGSRRTQYFYNILLLILLSLILYLFSSQLLSQAGGGGSPDRVSNSINSIEFIAAHRSSSGKGASVNNRHAAEASGSYASDSSPFSNDFTLKTGQLSTETNHFKFGGEKGETINEDDDDGGDDNSDQRKKESAGDEGDAHQFDNIGKGTLPSNNVATTKETLEQTTAKDWIRTFAETAHKLYSMFSPDYLKEFRQWAVKQQRRSIEREMKGYKYQTGKNVKLKDLIMEKGGQPIRNVIFTTWRSGSTFLGETLDSHPGTFYHYEPLLHFGIKQVRSGSLAQDALGVLNNLLSCNYTGLEDYMTYGKTHQWLFSHNTRVWQYCEKSWDVCWDPKFLSDMCKLFPFQSVKTVRMRLRLAKTLLENKTYKIRLILLVRDPRGTMQSRNHRDWCPDDPDCYDPSKLCMDMVDDFTYAEILRRKYPDRFLPIRYEDVSLSPYESMQKIFKFFRLQYHPQVDKFLSSHTVENSGGVSSTFRDSKTTPFHWRNDFIGNFSLVTDIQSSCRNAMKLWGYEPVTDVEQLLKFNPLKKPPWPEMLVLNNTEANDEMYAK